jgi:hypothetical protein
LIGIVYVTFGRIENGGFPWKTAEREERRKDGAPKADQAE